MAGVPQEHLAFPYRTHICVNWIFLATGGSLLHAVANHTDKYLLTRYLKQGDVAALTIFSALFSALVLPATLLVCPDVLNVTPLRALALTANGMLLVLALLCYFHALQRDEASYVVPLYQTIPLFGFVLGYGLLGETVSPMQAAASCVVAIGALVLSFEIAGPIRFKREVVLLMLLASLCYALNGVAFKWLAVDDGFWPCIFWTHVGKVVSGLLFLLLPGPRRRFVALLKDNDAPVLGINSVSETLFIAGDGLAFYATLFAPVVLVQAAHALQPVFVLALGVALSVFFPQLGEESLGRKQMLQKLIGVAAIIAGTFFLTACSQLRGT